jgi:hypothetical protein
MLAAIPFHLLYHSYNGISFVLRMNRVFTDKRRRKGATRQDSRKRGRKSSESDLRLPGPEFLIQVTGRGAGLG